MNSITTTLASAHRWKSKAINGIKISNTVIVVAPAYAHKIYIAAILSKILIRCLYLRGIKNTRGAGSREKVDYYQLAFIQHREKLNSVAMDILHGEINSRVQLSLGKRNINQKKKQDQICKFFHAQNFYLLYQYLHITTGIP